MLFIYCLFILCIGIELGVGFEFSYSKSNILLNDKHINNCLKNLFDKENKENEVNKIKIVNNKQINMFIDILKIYIENENINCKNINYYQFFKNDCYINENINEKNKIKQNIFVNDFMIDYGRTLSQYEKEKILEINKTSKKNIIFHVEDYDNLILKDNEFINNFEILEFPKIDKRLLNSYLINMIGYYQYNNDLLLINWKNYDIDKLSIKELENLMFDLHVSINLNNKNKKYSSINLCKNILNKKFKKLNKKYYDK